MNSIDYILFDAANTLIHKPSLWTNFAQAIHKAGYKIPLVELRRNHKLVSELIKFPDVTSEEFYNYFNKELLNSLGIPETPQLLNEIFLSCKNLPWEPFEDTQYLKDISCSMGVLSNFNKGLSTILSKKLPEIAFSHIFISEEVEMTKPNRSFFKYAAEEININPNKILYIGDSLKLDIIPALSIGMQAKLIDREGVFPYAKNRVSTFKDLF